MLTPGTWILKAAFAVAFPALLMGADVASTRPAGEKGGAAPAAMGADVPQRPLRVAVVNLNSVLNGIEEKKEALEELDKLRKEKAASLGELEEQIQNMTKKLNLLEPASDEYKNTQKKLVEINADYKAKGEAARTELINHQTDIVREFYFRIASEVTAYAREMDLDMVFTVQPVDEIERAGYRELQPVIALRKIIYYRGEFDVTDRIIERLNKTYQEKKAKAAAATKAAKP